MKRRKRAVWTLAAVVLSVLLCVNALVLVAGHTPIASAGSAGDPSLEQIHNVAKSIVNGQHALSNTGYVYQGWRTNGGPWFNSVLDWLASRLSTMGFSRIPEEKGKFPSKDSYWFQTDLPGGAAWEKGFIWDPKYASLEIVGKDGDDDFDFEVDTFDPTDRRYYPDDMGHEWLMANIGTPEEASINQRCRLAMYSGFTDPPGVKPNKAKGITAEVVYVGKVAANPDSGKITWSDNTDQSLKGKIVFGIGRRRDVYRLAVQEGASVALSSETNAYNNPIIDGKELYPNTVKYASVPNSSSGGPVAFNISPADERYLVHLLQNAKSPLTMKAVAIGEFRPYTPEEPLRTLVAEIRGSDLPDERVLFLAHVQEPGACDNASGVGLQLELVRSLKSLIDRGALPRPKRTMTFIWGAETIMGGLWKEHHPEQLEGIRAVLVLDMVGEDPEKTGGNMRIEKMPDPSAVYAYGLDLLPSESPPPMTDDYVRRPDKHTLWGVGELEYWPYPGHFLNDLYFASARLVAQESPAFKLGSNPWEGGSDHDPFLWNVSVDKRDAQGNPAPEPIPALLTWHFTDYVYHSSEDTMDKVSPRELKDVGVTTLVAGYAVANAGPEQAQEIMKIVSDRAKWRFSAERRNSLGHLLWAFNKNVNEGVIGADLGAAIDRTLVKEIEILSSWKTWYEEAIRSCALLAFGENAARDGSARYGESAERKGSDEERRNYEEFEHACLSALEVELQDATANAREIAGLLKDLSDNGGKSPISGEVFTVLMAKVLDIRPEAVGIKPITPTETADLLIRFLEIIPLQ